MSELWLLPVIGAIIGYTTNVLAIKSLFKPHKPVRFFFWSFQGLLPRYREDLARKAGLALEEEILTLEDMENHWREIGLEEEVEKVLGNYFQEKLSRWLILIPQPVREQIFSGLEKLVKKDIQRGLQEVRDNLAQRLLRESNLGELVADKIMGLDMRKTETLVLQVVSRELRYVEIMGGILGFLVGLGQMFFLRFFSF